MRVKNIVNDMSCVQSVEATNNLELIKKARKSLDMAGKNEQKNILNQVLTTSFQSSLLS